MFRCGSNNTNKLSPQEPVDCLDIFSAVQIIQINLVLKNRMYKTYIEKNVQIIQINLVLKNAYKLLTALVQFK